MILANKNGTIALVDPVKTNEKSTIVQESGGTTKFTVKASDDHRKIFDGENALSMALLWIEEQVAISKAAKMKARYPLCIENVGGDTYIVMSKGHHGADEFMAAVRSDGYDWPLGVPQQVWVKSVPDSTGKFHTSYVIVEKGTRGAWPATYAWEAYGEEQYKTPEQAILN